MKVILIGYPGSQFLVPGNKYLTDKYLPGFDVRYLNNKDNSRDGWSGFVKDYLKELDDDLIVFALDDYLLREPLNQEVYTNALVQFEDPTVMCVKIHRSTPQEHEEYPVTTQYTIWRRSYLIELLCQTSSPWDFEIRGSKLFNESGYKSVHGMIALEYYTSSALSARWQGVRLYGLTEADAAEVTTLISSYDGQK